MNDTVLVVRVSVRVTTTLLNVDQVLVQILEDIVFPPFSIHLCFTGTSLTGRVGLKLCNPVSKATVPPTIASESAAIPQATHTLQLSEYVSTGAAHWGEERLVSVLPAVCL